MRITLTAMALAVAFPCIAAEGSALTSTFGNTIVSTYPDGRTAELWLHPDGSYDAEGRRRDRTEGHWNIKGEKLCLKQSHPLPFPFAYCTPLVAGGVGTRWDGKAVTGEAIRIQLVRGKVDPSPS
ncbi:MAG TPA: hypothetical protein VIJ94_05465 [Caulobacteraceae bacterium]